MIPMINAYQLKLLPLILTVLSADTKESCFVDLNIDVCSFSLTIIIQYHGATAFIANTL